MADEPQVIRGIDWKSTFPFTLIFRSFRVAVHPSKLILALLSLLLIYIGGRVLDGIWPDNYQAIPNELGIYEASRGEVNATRSFTSERDAVRKALVDRYNARLNSIGHPDGNLADIRGAIKQRRNTRADQARNAYNEYIKAQRTEEELRDAELRRDREIAAAYREASAEYATFEPAEGIGLFDTFFNHQLEQLHRIARRAREGSWIVRGGVVDETFNFFTVAPGWAFRHHPIFFTLFFIYFLAIWAVFGGAIARIAAVQVARDEKISFRQALSFSAAKFLSFVSAPIIPMIIVAVVGLIVTLVAFILGNIPSAGPLIVGLLYVLALAAGFVMTLVLIGLFGGFNLMYPTIAVEGSDSFDAISRSFSYLYARPWRLLFYTVVAAIYGALCYVFVRLFIKLMLSLTHLFTDMGIVQSADNTAPLWPTIWPDPLTADRLSYSIDWLTLDTGEKIGAFFVAFWVYLVIAMLGAFAISFYFSANTIIYSLMRHEVDATELDDVYLEQTDEDFAEMPATTTAPAPVTTATTTDAAPPPAGDTPPASA